MFIKAKYSVEINDEVYEGETQVRLDYETIMKLVMEKISKEVGGCDSADIYLGEITLETEPIF